MILSLMSLLARFARGGGGGSGGGSSGGGSIIVLIGYVPMHILGAFLRRARQKHKILFDMLQIGGWLITVLFVSLLVIGFKGFGALAGIGVFAGMGAGLYGWFGRLKTNKIAEAKLQQVARTDSNWSPQVLMSQAAEIFQRFQTDWSNGNTVSMQQYLTPWYHYHISLMMLALQQAGRINQMSNVQILSQKVEAMEDTTDNAPDEVTIGFNAQATDQLIDIRDQGVLFTDQNEFVEYWKFQRDDTSWRLAGIDQATANYSAANVGIQQFAAANQFGYSLDWGWLLLPRRGQLFGTGKFGVSDINNHVIGMHNNVLIQIYTYKKSSAAPDLHGYLVAQIQLPKPYGDILIRHRQGFASRWFGVRGLEPISMEWPDFNKKYEVFASVAEGPTSFELLHPVFMETLEAAPFEVNLEVVDNVVYFYTRETGLFPEHYPAMLAILQEAFRQMRM